MSTFDEVARVVDFCINRDKEETQCEEPRREPIREDRSRGEDARELRSQSCRTTARPNRDPVCIMCAPERHSYKVCKYNTPHKCRQ